MSGRDFVSDVDEGGGCARGVDTWAARLTDSTGNLADCVRRSLTTFSKQSHHTLFLYCCKNYLSLITSALSPKRDWETRLGFLM